MLRGFILLSKTNRNLLPRIARSLSVASAMESSQPKPKLQISVDITSDVACPWCWIGKRHLDAAVQKLSQDFEFNIHWKPFLLNPHVPEEGVPLADYLRHKFGQQAAERFLTGQSPIAQHGQAVGITFNPSRLVVPTRKSHILLDYAAKEGKQHELQEVIFRAYFAEGRNVNDDVILRELVSEVGLDADRALAALGDSEAIHHYEEGVKEAQRNAVTGVPHFEISLSDNPSIRQQFSGAQPIDTFVSIFNRLRMLAKV